MADEQFKDIPECTCPKCDPTRAAPATPPFEPMHCRCGLYWFTFGKAISEAGDDIVNGWVGTVSLATAQAAAAKWRNELA